VLDGCLCAAAAQTRAFSCQPVTALNGANPSQSRNRRPLPAGPWPLLQDDGQLRVTDSKGDAVWSSGSPVVDRRAATQLISSGTPSLACIFSGPPATTLVERGLGARELGLTAAGKPQLVDVFSAAVVWAPAAYPLKPPGSYRLCVTSTGALVTQGGDGSGAPIWQAPAAPPAAAASGPFSLLVNASALLVLDRSCRAVFTAGGGPPASGAAGPQAAQQRERPPKAKAAASTPPSAPYLPAGSLPSSAATAATGAAFVAAPSRRPPGPAAAPKGATAKPPVTSAATPPSSRPGSPGTTGIRLAPVVNKSKGAKRPPSSMIAAGVQDFKRRPPQAPGRLQPAAAAASAGALVCGGWNLCGVDGACPRAPACPAGRACKRSSAYTWVCKPAPGPATSSAQA
jgi:hypothetical protein